MNLLGISEGPALGHRPERFKRRFVTRNRPPALQLLDIAAYLADIDAARDADVDRCRVCRGPALLSATSPEH